MMFICVEIDDSRIRLCHLFSGEKPWLYPKGRLKMAKVYADVYSVCVAVLAAWLQNSCLPLNMKNCQTVVKCSISMYFLKLFLWNQSQISK